MSQFSSAPALSSRHQDTHHFRPATLPFFQVEEAPASLVDDTLESRSASSIFKPSPILLSPSKAGMRRVARRTHTSSPPSSVHAASELALADCVRLTRRGPGHGDATHPKRDCAALRKRAEKEERDQVVVGKGKGREISLEEQEEEAAQWDSRSDEASTSRHVTRRQIASSSTFASSSDVLSGTALSAELLSESVASSGAAYTVASLLSVASARAGTAVVASVDSLFGAAATAISTRNNPQSSSVTGASNSASTSTPSSRPGASSSNPGSSSSSSSTAPASSSNKHSLQKRFIPAIVVPIVVVAAALVVLFLLCRRRRRQNSAPRSRTPAGMSSNSFSGQAQMAPNNNSSQSSFATSPSAIGVAYSGDPRSRWGRRSLLDIVAGAAGITTPSRAARGRDRSTAGSSFGGDRERSIHGASISSIGQGVGGYNSQGGYQPGMPRPVAGGVYPYDQFQTIIPVASPPSVRSASGETNDSGWLSEDDEGSVYTRHASDSPVPQGEYEDDVFGGHRASVAQRATPYLVDAHEATRSGVETAMSGDEVYYTDAGSFVTHEEGGTPEEVRTPQEEEEEDAEFGSSTDSTPVPWELSPRTVTPTQPSGENPRGRDRSWW